MNFLTVDNVIVKNRTKLVLRYFIIWVERLKRVKKTTYTYEFSKDLIDHKKDAFFVHSPLREKSNMVKC